ncbi:MAG: TIR domain-containing protein [Gammaproteobacteria bacterium]|nr:TIR domain-containing protein [Gammaproteobacteria bacterium]
MKSVFVSYKYEDKQWKDRLAEWSQGGRLGENVRITEESRDVRQDGQSAIRGHINPIINGAACVILIVGQDTHNSTGVDYELRNAKSARKPIIAVRVPHTSGALPKLVAGQREVSFEPGAIARAISS